MSLEEMDPVELEETDVPDGQMPDAADDPAGEAQAPDPSRTPCGGGGA